MGGADGHAALEERKRQPVEVGQLGILVSGVRRILLEHERIGHHHRDALCAAHFIVGQGHFVERVDHHLHLGRERAGDVRLLQQSKTLLDILQEEKTSKYSGGIYHKTQIDLTYNSNHIEGSRLTHEQTRFIFETNTIGVSEDSMRRDRSFGRVHRRNIPA